MMYKKILIATDGSPLATKGLDHGLRLAKGLGARVTVLTVSEPWFPPVVDPYGYYALDDAQLMAMRQSAARAAEGILKAARSAADAAGVVCETAYEPTAHPADAIVAYAQESGADLIVMASHGRRGVQRVLLGSQTNHVLSHSPVPVLVVK